MHLFIILESIFVCLIDCFFLRNVFIQMQKLTVFEPDDSMIEVAIASMEKVIPPDDSDAWKLERWKT